MTIAYIQRTKLRLHIGSVIYASGSGSLYEPGLVDSVGCFHFPGDLNPSDSHDPSSLSSERLPELYLLFGCGSYYLFMYCVIIDSCSVSRLCEIGRAHV